MHLGLQVDGVAWREVIERMCERLRPLAVEAKARGLDFRILAVKEKFGTLRIAYRDGTDEIEAEVQRARIESSVTCERCGGVGDMRDVSGWVRVLCGRCLQIASQRTTSDA